LFGGKGEENRSAGNESVSTRSCGTSALFALPAEDTTEEESERDLTEKV
jgi:hypothetical protein